MRRSFSNRIFSVFGMLVMMTLYTNCSASMDPEAIYYLKNTEGGQGTESLPSTAEEAEILYDKGVRLYSTHCARCHAAFDKTVKPGRSMGEIMSAAEDVSTMAFVLGLPLVDIEAIAYALNPVPVTPPTTTLPGTPAPVTTTTLPAHKESVAYQDLKVQTCAPTAISRDLNVLSGDQYKNIMTDIFGFSPNTSALETRPVGYLKRNAISDSSGIQNENQLEVLLTLAESVVAHVDKNYTVNLAKFSGGCDVKLASCQEKVLLGILTKLFRRDVLATDSDYVAIKAKFSSSASLQSKVKYTLMAGLVNPRFLYIVEYKKGLRSTALKSNVSRDVDAFELANRLSFFIWNSAPDDVLLASARSGKLVTATELKAQAKRLMADSRSQRLMASFTRDWLGIGQLSSMSKSTTTFPSFSSTLMNNMRLETEYFGMAMLKENRDIAQFFTSSDTYVERTLASIYGITGPSTTTFVKASRPQINLHAGIMSHGSVSAVTSANATDPIHRGIFAFERYLCGETETPPEGATSVVIHGSKLEQLQTRAGLRSCNGCHAKFEPLGYVAEELNPLGQYRKFDEAGHATGLEVNAYGGAVKVKNLNELGRVLAGDARTGLCISENLTKYSLKTAFASTAEINCQLQNNVATAYKGGNKLQSYIETTILSPVFLRRLEEK